MSNDPLTRLDVTLRTQDSRASRDECRKLILAGLPYEQLAKTIWRWIVEKSVADPSWLPAASCVNFADSFVMVDIQRPEDQHRLMVFGEPAPDFAREEPPLPLDGSLQELQSRLPVIAAGHDWLLTERCLLGIAQRSDVQTTLACLVQQLLRPDYLGARSNAWWTELRLVTARCMVEIWQRLGDDGVLPVCCRVGARLCARRVTDPDEHTQHAMHLLMSECSKLGARGHADEASFDEARFKQQMGSGDITKMFAAITEAWLEGASVEQLEHAMIMHCVQRVLTAAHHEDANWPNLRNDMMAVANISKLKPIDESYSIQAAYHAAWLIACTGSKGLGGDVPEVADQPVTSSSENVLAVIDAVKSGDPEAAISRATSYAASGEDGIELLRRVYLEIGQHFTYAGQRCMIEAWKLAKEQAERRLILAAAVGWEAHWRRQHASGER